MVSVCLPSDAFSQHLPSYLGFSYLGRGVSLDVVMVERSDRMWSTGEGNGKPLQYSGLENPMNSVKQQKDER